MNQKGTMVNIIALVVFVSLLTQQAFCQDEINSGGDKDGVGPTRNIYSQRLSPHRVMHFGKRPANPVAPTVMTSRVYDLYEPGRQRARLPAEKYPYLLSIELDRGQTLPEEFQALEMLPPPPPPQPSQPMLASIPQSSRDIIYSFEAPQVEAYDLNQQRKFARKQQQQQQQQSNKHLGSRLMKLISGDASGDSASSLNGDELDRGQPTETPEQAINVSSRSVPMARGNTFNLPNSYISGLLYGRQSSTVPSYSSYNKKAEPKSNLFMHFG